MRTEAWFYAHNKIHEMEQENAGVEGAHKSELAAEGGARVMARHAKRRYREHPARNVAKWERKERNARANADFQKMAAEHPELSSNPLSRIQQKWKQKRQYAKEAKKVAKNSAKAAKKTAAASGNAAKRAARFVTRHPVAVLVLIVLFLLCYLVAAISSIFPTLGSGLANAVSGTSYASEDTDLLGADEDYTALERELADTIASIESDHPGYDEYRYSADEIGHNPYELASYLSARYHVYTREQVQGNLRELFEAQYELTLTEEVEIRYRTETSTDPETGETTTEEVPYEYYILHVSLTNRDITTIAPEVLTAEQLQMFRVYLETSGNKPLLFGGGSADTSASEDLSGVQFVNGTRPGNPQLVELAKGQVGNVGGAPYWSWYGFDSRVAWCACFVSWCYGQAGLSEPRFAACQSQGIPWFTSHGQWGARGYENIAPGDAIFFDWDLDGSADHVGLVIGRDESRVYTVEGNSGDACKIKSYPLDYACIKGYGLMNWN